MQDGSSSRNPKSLAKDLPGQIVLVLQGGGALGSYQAGVYQALHDAGIEPDWIIVPPSPLYSPIYGRV